MATSMEFHCTPLFAKILLPEDIFSFSGSSPVFFVDDSEENNTNNNNSDEVCDDYTLTMILRFLKNSDCSHVGKSFYFTVDFFQLKFEFVLNQSKYTLGT